MLQRVLDAVLRYHHGEGSGGHDAALDESVSLSSASRLAIDAHLSRRFFEALCVPRREIEEALRRLTLSPLCVIHGGRGVGKSTAVRFVTGLLTQELTLDQLESGEDLVDELRRAMLEIEHDRDWYLYVDAEARRSDLSGEKKICDLVYEEFLQRAQANVPGFQATWRRFIEERYEPAANAMERLEHIKSLLDTAGLADNEELMRDAVTAVLNAFTDFDNAPGKIRLRSLLDCLATEFGIEPGVAIDNIDRFSAATQVEIVRSLLELCPPGERPRLRNSIVGIRTENLEEVISDLKGIPGLTKEESVKITLGETGQDALIEVIRRRVREIPAVLNLPEVAEELDRQKVTGYLPPTDPASQSLGEAIEVLQGLIVPSHDIPRSLDGSETVDRNYFRQLLRWHNESIRAVCASAYEVGFLIASDSDPIYRFAALRDSPFWPQTKPITSEQFGRQVRSRVRFCRSFFIRHFVISDSRQLMFNHALLVYEKPAKPTPNHELPYLRLHLLQAIRQLGGTTGVSLRDLIGRLEQFGASKSRIRRSLQELRQPVKGDERGLVHLDFNGLVRDAQDSTTVRLLPAAEMLIDDLCYMNDYVFWNAFNANGAADFFDSRDPRTVDASDLASDEFRIRVAMDYLLHRILPRYVDVFEMKTARPARHLIRRGELPVPADYLAEYIDTFGDVLTPVEIAREIREFAIAGHDISQHVLDETLVALRNVTDLANAQFRAHRLQPRLRHRRPAVG